MSWVFLFHPLQRFMKSPSFYLQSNTVPFDPPIVDRSAELDRILSAQDTATRRVRSPYSEQTTSSEPDTPDPTSSKPRLSDALSHLTFSPKRPRSPALRPRSASSGHTHGRTLGTMSISNQQRPPQLHQETARPSSVRVSQVDVREGEPTPRPRKVHMRTQPINSDNVLRPPTPSTGNSNFTRLAKGLAREIEAEQSRWHTPLEVEGTGVGTKESGLTRNARETGAISGKRWFFDDPLSKRGCKGIRMLAPPT